MIYIFIAFLLIAIYKIDFKGIKKCDEKALSHERTTMINGFFVALILFSHFNSYIQLSDTLANHIYMKIFNEIAQLMVTTFLFYSGYGILESIKSKPNYIDNFFKNRFLKIFISFAIAICLYIILNISLGIKYPIKTILLSFTGWESIGNSNWFIFATFVMYIAVMISFKIFRKDKDTIKGILLSTIGSLLYILVLVKLRQHQWWFNTILCFNLGMFVSYYKKNILNFLKDNKNYLLVLGILLLSLIICRKHGFNYIAYELYALSFVFFVFMITLKVKVGNKVLEFLGKNTFNIYILQRIGYILFNKIGLLKYNMYLYFIASVCFTLVLSVVFDKGLKIILKKIIK